MARSSDPTSPTPEAALQRLVEGNRRFQQGAGSMSHRPWDAPLATEGQRPFAIILGCSDSRIPVEMHDAVRANVRASADHLRHGSPLIEDLVLAGRVAVIGAEYELATGSVHFFDGLPLAPRP